MSFKLHPGCVECKLRNVAPVDIIDPDTNKILVRKGSFAINCKGIPLDTKEYLTDMFEKAGESDTFTDNDISAFVQVRDPVAWAAANVTVLDKSIGERAPWVPQGATLANIEKYDLDPTSTYYQELMVKCTARRQLYRIGRRSGKTWTIAIKALHKMITNKNYRVLVITPVIAQLDLVFGQINEFLDTSSVLASSKARFIKTPQRRIELSNGSYMVGFVSGNESIRGQAADMIIIDEADYLTTDDMSAIAAILSEHKETILIVASTPSGAHEQFYKWDHDPQYRSFHYPSMCRPLWDDEMEQEQRKENPGVKYLHEILAEYGEIEEGVFQHTHIDRAIENGHGYRYEDQVPDSSKLYCFGIDWNPVHGTEIVVIQADPAAETPEYKVVDVGSVFREGHTQVQAMNEIIRLNRKWLPEFIYVDRGAGSTQIEVLEEFGMAAEYGTPDRRLIDIIKAVDFGSKVELRHPVDGTIIKQHAKPAVVESAVRFLEANQITLSKYDSNLIRALRGFIVDKIAANGRQTYKMINADIEDHRLDAFMIGMFAFTMEFSKLGNPQMVSTIGYSGHPGEQTKPITSNISVPIRDNLKPSSRAIGPKDRPKDQKEIEKERELNFVPAESTVQSVNIGGQMIQRVSHQVAQQSQKKVRLPLSPSRAPIRRSTFR